MDDSVAVQEAALKLQTAVRKPVGPAATGECLFCEYPLAEGMRWCDANCRSDWERIENAKRMGGSMGRAV
jgi:hypothetical protein